MPCNKKYDIIFIDAAKGQYEHYFNKSALLLNKSGLIIADNVLYRGMVAQYDVIPRRQKTLVKKLDLFLKNISKDKRFNTTIIPIGDGLSISVKL